MEGITQNFAQLLLKSSPEIVVTGIALWLRVHMLDHTTYGGPNGDDDPEAGILTALRHLVTGDPDRGGHRRFLKKLPSMGPMSHYSDRFLATVLQAFVMRAIAMSVSTADEGDPLWDEVHLPRSDGRVFRPDTEWAPRHASRVDDGKTLCRQMLSYVAGGSVGSATCDDHDSVLKCYQSLLPHVPLASRRKMQTAFRSGDANARCDEAPSIEGELVLKHASPLTRSITKSTLVDLSQAKWEASLEDVEKFLRTFIASIAQTSPKVWRNRIDMSESKLRRVVRLAVRYLNQTDCLDATLTYKLGNAESTHESVSIGGALPGKLEGLGASATRGKTRTRHRKVVAGFKITFFDAQCIAKLTDSQDKEIVKTMKHYPNDFMRMWEEVKHHTGTATIVVSAILAAKYIKNGVDIFKNWIYE